MSNRNVAASFALVIMIFPTMALSARANLITNGDFSAGDVGFTTDYQFAIVNSAAGQYTLGKDPHLFNEFGASFGDHTSGDGLMMIVNGATESGRTVWQQTIAVKQDTDYSFSGWLASWGNRGGGNPVLPSLRFFVNGYQIGGDYAPTLPDGTWSHFNFIWQSDMSSLATIRIENTVTEFGGNDFVLDDLRFSAVPEPNSMILAVLGFAVLGGSAGARHARRARSATLPPR